MTESRRPCTLLSTIGTAFPPSFTSSQSKLRCGGSIRFVLEALFVERGHSHVIVAEDDMVFSPDFALFFEQLAVLLDRYRAHRLIALWKDTEGPGLK